MKYKDKEYARQRLDRTVVRYKGIPVYLQNYDGWVYSVVDISTGESKKKDIRKMKLDITPVPLGYINSRRYAYYATRKPARRWKQGLSNESFNIHYYNNEGRHQRKPPEDLIASKELSTCIQGVYPSFEKVYHSINRGEKFSYAFNRKFALLRTANGRNVVIYLLFRDMKVGVVSGKGIDLHKEYSYLKEALEEAMKV